MPIATVTSKGQVTIPKAVRDALEIGNGDRLEFVVQDDGSCRVRTLRVDIRDLFGVLKSDLHLTIDEMNEVIRQGWAGTRREP